jgi:hypothetical protein
VNGRGNEGIRRVEISRVSFDREVYGEHPPNHGPTWTVTRRPQVDGDTGRLEDGSWGSQV